MNPFEMKKVVDTLNKECLNADAVFIAVLKGNDIYTKIHGKFLDKGKLMKALKGHIQIILNNY